MIRTRFAPSPTGYLHIGGARTALFAWLFARHYQGQFILRIEDTDQARSTSEAVQAILEGMQWLGLDYDEGPYFQSQRFTRYQTVLAQLLDTGNAYRCYCKSERLTTLRDSQLANKQKPRYDGYCRKQTSSPQIKQPFVVRFKNPIEGQTIVEDKILGTIQFNNLELDDFILARSDGTPTYNFTVVVDDYEMKISHVIRGNDHLNNTARQINVLKALKATIPVYLHLPMLHNAQGKKISKREGAISITEYREVGFLPEALINYLARLGWSHGDQEIFSQIELIRHFNGQHLSKAPAILNQDKLLWLNQHYLKQIHPENIARSLRPLMQNWKHDGYPEPALSDIVLSQRERVKTLKEMAEKSRFFYETPLIDYDLPSHLLPIIELFYERIEKLAFWNKPALLQILRKIVEIYQLKPHQLFQPLRAILTGSTVSPPLDDTLYLLGKSRVLARLDQAMKRA